MSHSRGSAISVCAPRAKLYKGPFGRLFPKLPPWRPKKKTLDKDGKPILRDDQPVFVDVPNDELEEHFITFANAAMTEQLKGDGTPEEPEALANDADATRLDGDFGSASTPAGYTYFGQFVDHDVTFDPSPLGTRTTDPNGLDNFRTPRLDLDCVYGSGPSDQPYFFVGKSGKFHVATIAGTGLRDLPRNAEGRAIIGDMRNDENAIVAQVQLAFLLAHNNLVDRVVALKKAGNTDLGDPFTEARRALTWLYQWVVVNDFLRRVCVDKVIDAALKKEKTPDGRTIWKKGLSEVYDWGETPFMPVEFAVAAYRFGHSMVRNSYQTNFAHNGLTRIPIFNNIKDDQDEVDMRGFGPNRKETALQWDWFLKMRTSGGPFPQMARAIDSSLANSLMFLPENDKSNHVENKLAARNLIRGVLLDLPSGTDVARLLGVNVNFKVKGDENALWHFILREAKAQSGDRLGNVGSIIVCAVFAGLLMGDDMSWVCMAPDWAPDKEPLFASGEDNKDGTNEGGDFDGSWDLSAIIRISGLPVDDVDLRNQTDGIYRDKDIVEAVLPEQSASTAP